MKKNQSWQIFGFNRPQLLKLTLLLASLLLLMLVQVAFIYPRVGINCDSHGCNANMDVRDDAYRGCYAYMNVRIDGYRSGPMGVGCDAYSLP